MKKQGILFSLLLALFLAAGPQASAKDETVPLYLEAKPLSVQAITDADSVFLPVRAVGEALGYDVEWHNENGVQSVTLQGAADSVILDLTNQTINDNSHSYYAMSSSPRNAIFVTSGHTYLDSSLLDPLLGLHTDYRADQNEVWLEKIPENDITVTPVSDNAQEQYLKMTVQYPQISGLSDTQVQDSINSVLKQAALTSEDEGRQNAKEMAQSIADGYSGAVTQVETDFNYAVKYNQNGLLSIVLSDYQYAGGAHGSTVQSSYTFDLSTGKALSLSDLMLPDSGYAAYIDSAIRTEIDRRVKDGVLYEFEDGKFTDIGANPEFYLSDSGLVFYFQQYAYFPYAAGIQEFLIPYADVESMLKPAFAFLYSQPEDLQAGTANTLSVGEIGKIALAANPTTGYTWHCTVSDPSVLQLVSSTYTPAASSAGLVGSGGMSRYFLRAVGKGQATVTCRYYRNWEGEDSTVQTAVYQITVS